MPNTASSFSDMLKKAREAAQQQREDQQATLQMLKEVATEIDGLPVHAPDICYTGGSKLVEVEHRLACKVESHAFYIEIRRTGGRCAVKGDAYRPTIPPIPVCTIEAVGGGMVEIGRVNGEDVWSILPHDMRMSFAMVLDNHQALVPIPTQKAMEWIASLVAALTPEHA